MNALRWWRRKDEYDTPIIHCSVDEPATVGDKVIVDGDPFIVLAAGCCKDLRSGDTGSWTLSLREPTKEELGA